MRKGVIRELIEQASLETGGNQKAAGRVVADRLQGLLEQKKVRVEDFSFKALFEEIVNPDHSLDMHSDTQEIAEAIVSSAFPTITNTVINATVIPAYETAVGDAARIVTEMPATKTSDEEIAGYTAGGNFEQRTEHMSYAEDMIGEKYWTVRKSDFGKIISLTREAIFDDRTGQLISRARGIGEKGGQLKAKIITQTLEVAARTSMGESTSRAAVYGGSAVTASNFYNVDHSAIIDSAGTNKNLLASNPLGTAGNLQNAVVLFSSMKDENGDEITVIPNALMYHPTLSETAWELLFSKVKRGDSNDLDNFHYQKYQPIELPFLTSGTTWFIGDPKKQLVWLWVWKPETKVQTDNSHLAFQSQIVLRYRFNWYGGCAHTDYRFIVKCTA